MKEHNIKDPYNLTNSKSATNLKKGVARDSDVFHIPITVPGKDEKNNSEKDDGSENKSLDVAEKDKQAEQEQVKRNEEPERKEEPSQQAEQKETPTDKDEEIRSLNEQIKRIYADFENFRRRKEDETSQAKKYASEKLIIDMLPIIDNFERAIESSRTSKNFDSLFEGVVMINRQLKDLFEKEGLTEIPAKDEAFDPALHQAVMKVENDELPDETIVEELQKGYRLKEKVIRPSMVKVSRKSE